MFKKFALVVGLSTALVGMSAKAFSSETIALEKKNTVSLREPFTGSSINKLKLEIIALSNSLKKTDTIYLYLDTPGGEIVAGEELLAVIKSISQPVVTISNFAASMGYLTVQGSTGKRYVTENGILMSHRATVGAEGQTPGEFETHVGLAQKMTGVLSEMAAKRTGISLADYQKRVKDEYWVQGEEAVKDGQADGVVHVTCSADLSGTSAETVFTMFGPVEVEYADCPIATYPVAVHFDGGPGSSVEERLFQQAFMSALTDKPGFLANSSLQDSFYRAVK